MLSLFSQVNEPLAVGAGKGDINMMPLVEQIVIIFPQQLGGGVGRRIIVPNCRKQISHCAEPVGSVFHIGDYLPKKRMGFCQHGITVNRQVASLPSR